MAEKQKGNVRRRSVPGVLSIFTIVFVAASLLVPNFFSVGNLSTLLLQASTLTILTAAMALCLMMGSIDLSLGGVVSMTGVLMACTMRAGYSAWLAIAIGLTVGIAFGLFNGVMVAKLRIPAFIATFGSAGIAQSIANTVSAERTVSWETGTHTNLIDFLGNKAFSIQIGQEASQTLSVANLLIITVVVLALLLIAFKSTTLGSNIYALGANEETARLSGVSVTKWRMVVYAISGGLAALGGVIVMVRSNSIQPTVGSNMEFQACVAAVLGGNVMEGGKGSLSGAILGALTLYVIRSAMSLLGIDTSWVQVVIGGVLIIGMLLNNAAAAREKKESLKSLAEVQASRALQEEVISHE